MRFLCNSSVAVLFLSYDLRVPLSASVSRDFELLFERNTLILSPEVLLRLTRLVYDLPLARAQRFKARIEQRENDADALAMSPIRAAPAETRDWMQSLDKEGMQQTRRGLLALCTTTKSPSLPTVQNRPSLQLAEAAADASATKKHLTSAMQRPKIAADAQFPFEQNAAQEVALHRSGASSDLHETTEQTLLLVEQFCLSEAATDAVSEAENVGSMEQLDPLRMALDDVYNTL